MRECLKALCGCDVIYVLDDWTDSKGALTEVLVAKILGLEMRQVEDFEEIKPSYAYLFAKLIFKMQ